MSYTEEEMESFQALARSAENKASASHHQTEVNAQHLQNYATQLDAQNKKIGQLESQVALLTQKLQRLERRVLPAEFRQGDD